MNEKFVEIFLEHGIIGIVALIFLGFIVKMYKDIREQHSEHIQQYIEQNQKNTEAMTKMVVVLDLIKDHIIAQLEDRRDPSNKP